MQELDPYKTLDTEAVLAAGPPETPPLSAEEVTRTADYKNAPMLAMFLSGEFG